MWSFLRRKLAASIEQLNRASGREVALEAVAAIVGTHSRPNQLARIMSRALAFEASPVAYGAAHPLREQQHFNHLCDYEGSCCVSAALSAFFDRYWLADEPGYEAAFVEERSAELAKQGYSLMPAHVSRADCDAIVEFLGRDDLLFREDISGVVHHGYSLENVRSTTSNVCRIVDQSALLACPQITALVCSPSLVALAQDFLGAPPIHTQVNCWWSTPYSNELEQIKSAAQRFHQDRDYIKFLKIFVYLTEVDDNAGPHEFVAGSNVDYASVSKNKRRSSKRLPDEYLQSVYAKDRFRRFTAPRGTVILEDTSGFHKGSPVVKGHRLMLQLEFASSLYGAPADRLRASAVDRLAPRFRKLDRFLSAYSGAS